MDAEEILTLLFLEEEEDDDYFLQMSLTKKRRRKHELFVSRNAEGCFKILSNHFNNNDNKFIEYFRLSKEQFMRVLKLIENDISTQPSKRYRIPISAAEKLGVTIR